MGLLLSDFIKAKWSSIGKERKVSTPCHNINYLLRSFLNSSVMMGTIVKRSPTIP